MNIIIVVLQSVPDIPDVASTPIELWKYFTTVTSSIALFFGIYMWRRLGTLEKRGERLEEVIEKKNQSIELKNEEMLKQQEKFSVEYKSTCDKMSEALSAVKVSLDHNTTSTKENTRETETTRDLMNVLLEAVRKR